MQYDTITPVINRFNNLVDSLIEDFKEYNLDEETLIFLAEKTRNFIGFSELALFNVIFGVLENLNDVKYKFDEEVQESQKIIKKIFENMNKSLDTILAHEDEEEEEHFHDHNHEHHHHVDVDEVQDDVNNIVDCLAILKKFIGGICDITILTLKYHADEIKEEVFKKEYEKFKKNIAEFKNEFGE